MLLMCLFDNKCMYTYCRSEAIIDAVLLTDIFVII